MGAVPARPVDAVVIEIAAHRRGRRITARGADPGKSGRHAIGAGRKTAGGLAAIGSAHGRTAGDRSAWPTNRALDGPASVGAGHSPPGSHAAVGANRHAAPRFVAARASHRRAGRIAAARAFDGAVLHVKCAATRGVHPIAGGHAEKAVQLLPTGRMAFAPAAGPIEPLAAPHPAIKTAAIEFAAAESTAIEVAAAEATAIEAATVKPAAAEPAAIKSAAAMKSAKAAGPAAGRRQQGCRKQRGPRQGSHGPSASS